MLFGVQFVNHVEAMKENYAIEEVMIGGDMNASPRSFGGIACQVFVDAGYTEAYAACYSPDQSYTTYKKRKGTVSKDGIDHLYKQNGGELEAKRILGLPADGTLECTLPSKDFSSDHIPLLVDFELKQQASNQEAKLETTDSATGVMEMELADRTVMVAEGSNTQSDWTAEMESPEVTSGVTCSSRVFASTSSECTLATQMVDSIIRGEPALTFLGKLHGKQAKSLVMAVNHATSKMQEDLGHSLSLSQLKGFAELLSIFLESVFPTKFDGPVKNLNYLIDICYAHHQRPEAAGLISCILVFLTCGFGTSYNHAVDMKQRNLLVFFDVRTREQTCLLCYRTL
jgi:hypothetical protein